MEQDTKDDDDDDEEIRERVEWADTGYFDDQFDLTEEPHLVGKTLEYLARKCPEQGIVEKSAKLLGLGRISLSQYLNCFPHFLSCI